MTATHPYYLAGRPDRPNADLAVTDKYSGGEVWRVPLAGAGVLDEAIEAAAGAAERMRSLPMYRRREVLEAVLAGCEARAEELVHVLSVEAGKPLQHARGEVERLSDTIRDGIQFCGSELGEGGGAVMPLDSSPRAVGYRGMWKRVAIGPCGFITPWNFPLNLVAHKVVPAIAAGCPFVLKPASTTPVSALILAEVLAESGLPEGAFSVLPMRSADAGALVEDPRLRKLSFTGSAEVGWKLRSRAGTKRITLELGGNAACIVHRDADLEHAADRITTGAFYQSGQSCISVQRVYAHRDIYDDLRSRLIEKADALIVGDPKDENTFVGPIITEEDAKRIEAWVDEAVAGGANILCGGNRDGVMIPPTWLEGVPHDAKVNREEVFGPVAFLSPYDDFDDALRRTNDSEFGLQAGVFTNDIHLAMRAWDTLDVGGVMVNEVPSWRVDPMPYGGTKASGLGREGLRWGVESMTEVRLLVVRAAETR